MDGTQPVTRAILLSGGIDSIALAYLLRPEYALTVDYGQVAAPAEIAASRVVCEQLQIRHETVRIDCSAVGAGNMLPQGSNQGGHDHPLPAPTLEWWPYRNQLVITLAAARAVMLGISELVVGTVRSDREHRDGRPEFVELIDRLLRLQEGEIAVRAPALEMDSVELVRASSIPFELLAWSHSCHRSVYACGVCRGCAKHQQVFDALGMC